MMTDRRRGRPAPVPPAAPKPSRRALREALAETGGRRRGLRRNLAQPLGFEATYADAFRDLADSDRCGQPQRLIRNSQAEIFRILLNFSTCCTLRVQIALLQNMQADDRQPCRRSFEIASNYLEDFQKHLISMQAHVADLCQSRRRRPGCGNSLGKNSAKTMTGNLRVDGIALCAGKRPRRRRPKAP